jgi:hypothetical protein
VPPLVELLHREGAHVTVSSQVDNITILPEHLVDHDLETAWNSRTGELVGAWIAVTVPGTIEEVRLTAGHTGHGPKHEDYFTMNPRIRRVSVLQRGKVLGSFVLDPARRDLQTLKVHAAGPIRIRIDDVLPGSKASWREACISELEVWGTLPAGVAMFAAPAVTIALQPVVFDRMCATIDADKGAYHEREQRVMQSCKESGADMQTCGVDEPGEPECDVAPVVIAGLAPPWKRAALLHECSQSNYGPHTYSVVVESAKGTAIAQDMTFDDLDRRNGAELEVLEATVRDVLPGGSPELVLRTRTHNDATSEVLIVCRADPVPSCSTPVPKTVTVGPATLEFPNLEDS